MGNDVVVSFFGSANRPWLWKGLYGSLSKNSVPFELILVGNRIPKFKLPDNFHFVYSEVKPAQCVEIACRYATGEIIVYLSDDLVFRERAIDNMYEMFRRINDDKVMVGCRFGRNGKEFPEEQYHYWVDHLDSPKFAVGGMMKAKMWHQLGGIDRRFTALLGDLDIMMRLYETGGGIVRCEDAYVEELPSVKPRYMKNVVYRGVRKMIQVVRKLGGKKKSDREVGLYPEYGLKIDRPLFDSFWVVKDGSPENISMYCSDNEKGVLSKKRLSAVIPFEDKHILTVSQGPKGRWR